MPVSASQTKDGRRVVSAASDPDPSSDLKFISDLGRSLLFTVHPKKVAGRVAEAVLEGVQADACVFVAELDNIGRVSCSYSSDGKAAEELLDKSRFEKWLEFMPPQIGHAVEKPAEFLIRTGGHQLEYISPIHINGEIKGALIAVFGKKQDLTERKARLIEAATQMAAMSVNLSAHYEAALNDSINRAREEHRKFTEAVLDALPVSLYVVDREYRIVTWNRHREIGIQGIPRDSAIGRDVFQVLAKFPEDRLREEFERAFATGRLERIEQQANS